MLIQEVLTDLPPAEVIERAELFFTTRFSPYAGFMQDRGEGHIRFGIEAGEILIGAVPQDGRTLVRGSASRPHHVLSAFLTTLASPEDVRQNLAGPGVSGAGGA